ncbi:unnamed protein product, partial [Mesorhabditis spiculigera]
MSRLTLLVLCALVAAVASVDMCATCTTMCGDARANFKNTWGPVTVNDLKTFMEQDCKNKFSGAEGLACKAFVDQKSSQMLDDFKAGLTDQQICVKGGICT